MKRTCIALSGMWLAVAVYGDDAERGRALFLDRNAGHCVLCHQVQQLDAPFQGDIGPDLSAVGDRLDAATLRRRIADPGIENPETVMPAYGRTEGLLQVARDYQGQPVLSAQEIEDVVAFLLTLRASGSK